jgi:hypothetical protein
MLTQINWPDAAAHESASQWPYRETATIRANYESLKEVTDSVCLLARAVANDVAFWPKADMLLRVSDVRFRG